MAWINKILYKDINNNETTYDLGVPASQVYKDESNSFSLADLYTYLKKFFEKQSFMHYSSIQPPNNSRYMEWYCLEVENGNLADNVDTTINWKPNEQLS